MTPFDAADSGLASGLTWWSEIAPWLAIASFLALVSGVAAAWLIHARARALEHRLASLGRLEEVKVALDRLVASHADLDLRRMEHVLIDLRDGQRRLEDRLLAVIESAHAGDARPAASEPQALAERVVTRLLALGYEHIQLVTPVPEPEHDGEVLVEARRDGVPCKGRVHVRSGRIADVQIQAAYSTFP